ncbi:MAG: hypothetical protein WD772_01465 [Pseudohongiellaceae bacterium]
MYKTCPKCGYQQPPDDPVAAQECAVCGLVYNKWLKSLVAEYIEPNVAPVNTQKLPLGERITRFLIPPHPHIGRMEFIFCAAIFTVFLFWGSNFILLDFHSNEIGQSFLHNVNLVFHEAGHFIFIPAGRFMTILGGSLFQVLVPLFICAAFLVANKDGFGASIGLWWTGQSMMDLSPYIADATVMRLPLLGGGTGADRPGMHDWNNILRQLGWLAQDEKVATIVHFAGAAVMLLSFIWGAIMLRVYYRTLFS